MSPQNRRTLRIDDPVAGDACHVAPPGSRERIDARLRDIAPRDIHANPSQPRKRFDDASLAALAAASRRSRRWSPAISSNPPSGLAWTMIGCDSIRERGVLPSLDARQRRSTQPLGAGQSIELALIENVAREDLGVIEEARTIAVLLDELGVTATTLARRLGRSRSDLAHTVRLLELPDEAVELIDTGELSKGHGKALLTEPDHCRRRELAKRAGQGGWSVRTLEAEIARAGQPHRRSSQPHPDQVAAAAKLHDLLAQATGCEITARPHRLGYQLILDQNAIERLTELLKPADSKGERVPRGTEHGHALQVHSARDPA